MPLIISERNPLTPFTGPPDFDFWRLDKRLRATEMKVVYVGVPDPDYNGGERRWWDLAGSQGGTQGLDLAPHMTGFMHAPFASLFSEGPYQIGATYERTDYKKRMVNFGVMVSNSLAPDTSFRYRMLEQRWWASWSPNEDGYLGCFTRTHGWRWLRVRLAEDPKTPFELDPVAFENNFMQWDMTIVATQPFWCKRMESKSWTNSPEFHIDPQDAVDKAISDITGITQTGVTVSALLSVARDLVTGAIDLAGSLLQLAVSPIIGLISGLIGFPTRGITAPEHPIAQALVDAVLQPNKDLGEGMIRIPNRGTTVAHPKFLVSTPGFAWIQDGIGGPMVQLPLLTEKDGPWVMVDTDPIARTLTGADDPVDNNFLKILRNSQLIDLLIHDQITQTEPLWKRFGGKGFDNGIPPRTLATLKVRHSNADGTITALCPQRYKMAYA